MVCWRVGLGSGGMGGMVDELGAGGGAVAKGRVGSEEVVVGRKAEGNHYGVAAAALDLGGEGGIDGVDGGEVFAGAEEVEGLGVGVVAE